MIFFSIRYPVITRLRCYSSDASHQDRSWRSGRSRTNRKALGSIGRGARGRVLQRCKRPTPTNPSTRPTTPPTSLPRSPPTGGSCCAAFAPRLSFACGFWADWNTDACETERSSRDVHRRQHHQIASKMGSTFRFASLDYSFTSLEGEKNIVKNVRKRFFFSRNPRVH